MCADLLWWRGPGCRRLERALRVLCAAPGADQRLSRLLRQTAPQAREYAGGPAPARNVHCNR
ncbi:hypothetical protein ACFU3E_29010 [Streptomyces sp. NPDC057424]|uniref:hypothetical protein n=1 Tax=Streptomyces sp. NPDC057424 TaxID=3346127 RepID=UPI0036A3699E